MKKLIILGNGFDLRCGLKSSFIDFFNVSELKNVKRFMESQTLYTAKEINLFSLLLYNSYFRNETFNYDNFSSYSFEFRRKIGVKSHVEKWVDIESFIYEILSSSAISKLEKSYDAYFNIGMRIMSPCILEGDYINKYFQLAPKPNDTEKFENFYDFLMYELKRFEESFIKYLREEVDTNKFYKDKSRILINEIVENGDGIILNFNYTSPVCPNCYTAVNVHGTLKDKNIIIGINDVNINGNNSKLTRFTKTFRKLTSQNNVKVLSDNDLNEIIIYGHSLGEADYAYFQSIFDYINLYNSQTTIKFIYSDYFVPELEEKHKTDMAEALFNLIKTYGQTLTNKDNGNNLLHKMILEERIKLILNNFPSLDDFK